MNNDKNSGRKNQYSRKVTVIGGIIIAVALFLVAANLPIQGKSLPETITLSNLTEDLHSGAVIKIEDVMETGEVLVYYENDVMKTAMRDTGSPLLEQLNLLGVTRGELNEIEVEVVKSIPSMMDTPTGVMLAMALIGTPFGVAYYISRRDRYSKKTFQESEVPTIGFADVAGMDENLPELTDIVTFLKEGNRYTEMGARMPRGILMVGEPGTGKTLLAKALAGEAGVPFFATSGSEFVEVFVGVGASRMRALFQKARKRAPCIIFIDEIDAVGRSRHRSESGAEMEQDQTLNQLLVEMDGFDPSEGVIVLAATNRVDVLDSALTRPGRFDRRVYVSRPDVKGREAILDVHARGKKLAAGVTLANVAKATPGLVGADLANIINEAAICAVRNGHTEIATQDFDEAVEKVLTGGVPRKGRVMGEDERKIVAYHEAGHAVVMHTTEHADPVYKITIIPRGEMGGFTMSLPEQDQMLVSRFKMLARITGLLGGRAAEEIFFGDITNGASNDLSVATQLAEEMVMRLGMDTSAGLRVVAAQGRSIFSVPNNSQKTFEAIDAAINNILDGCYADAKRILLEKRAHTVAIADELLETETVNRERFEEIMGMELEPVLS